MNWLAPFTSSRIERVKGGASYHDVARQDGVSAETVRMACKRNGVRSLHKVGRPVSPARAERVAVAQEMRAAGLNNRSIGLRLGMSADAVKMMLRRAGQ